VNHCLMPLRVFPQLAAALDEYVAAEESREAADPSVMSPQRTAMHLWMRRTANEIRAEFAAGNVVQIRR
jgi:hypothetical protein